MSNNSSASDFPVEGLCSVESRERVFQPYFLISATEILPKVAWLLFPGGNGARHIKVDGVGRVSLSKNFIVRTAPFYARAGFAVAIVCPPSDQDVGMSDEFRKSPSHAIDILAMMDQLDQSGIERFYFISTSRGTLSAVSLASRIKDSRLKGVVLTASIEYKRHLRSINLSNIDVPVLLIHHRSDGCVLNSFPQALRTRRALSRHTSVTFMAVEGGETLPGEDPCKPLSFHGFYGIEDQVTNSIVSWVNLIDRDH